jgi:hypothetical protein
MSGVGDCFCVVTPNWRTSSGSRENASLTLFCTRTAAVSGSAPGPKSDHDLKAAVGAGDRLHVHKAFDTVDRFLERFSNRVRDFLRVCAGIGSTDDHARRDHFRIFAGWKDGNRNEPERKNDDGYDEREDRAVNEEF